MSTSLTLPAWSETGISCSQPPTFYRPGDLFTIAFCAIPRHRISILVDIPARAGLRPDAFPRDTLIRATLPAASPQALRGIHTDRSTPLSCSVSPLPTASHPRVGTGNASRPMLRVGPASPPPTPTRHTGLPALPWPLSRPSAFGASAFGASACGARGLPRQGPARYSGPLPSVHSPLHLSDSALSVQRVACLPNRLASSRRG